MDKEELVGEITGDESVAYKDWTEYKEAVESGKEKAPEETKSIKRPGYEFNVDKALDNIDLTFNGYVPSEEAINFFNVIRLVLGEEPEVSNSLMHYFLVDLVFNNIERDQYPYPKEIRDKIRINTKKLAIIAARLSAKALTLDSQIKTPDGHILMKDAKVGDEVLDRDGKKCNIIAKSQIFNKDVYKITLADGRTIKTSGDHDNIIWKRRRILEKGKNRCKNNRPAGMYETVVTTEQLYKNGITTNRTVRPGESCDKEYKYWIPAMTPTENYYDYNEKNYEFDPYTTGVILGDGSTDDSGFTRITAHKKDIQEYYKYIPYEFGEETKKYIDGIEQDAIMFSIKGMNKKIQKWIGTENSYTKRVPKALISGSMYQKLEVLKGLMDTDGTVYKNGYCSFTSVSKGLAEDVQELIRSLGGVAFISEQKTGSSFGKAWSVRIKIERIIFKLKRKLSRQKIHMKYLRTAITVVEKIEKEPTQCISVNSPTKAFLTDGYTVTHNSTVITAYLPIYVAITGKIPNFGNVMFMVGFGDSQQSGAKVQANTIRDFCQDSKFCKEYFEKMRFTDEECEFTRKGNGSIKSRSFMYKVKGAAGGSVRGIRYRTERPQCHARGTMVTTEHGTYPVEEHPLRSEGHFEIGKEVRVQGLTNYEIVSDDHKYWTKKCIDHQIEGSSKWCEAKDLTNRHWIGSIVDVDNAQSVDIHFKRVHISNGMLWRQVESVKNTKDKVELIPIQCDNKKLKSKIGENRAYETAFGISKNCFLFDDIIKNEADANSPIIMKKLKSMIYADAENALGRKGKIIAINTPFNKKDPIYSALEGGVWTPICLPLCEKISLDLKKKDYRCSWPQMHDYKKTMERYADAYYGGTLKEFNKELMLRISSEEERMVKDHMIQWFSRKTITKVLDYYTLVATTDFTASSSKKGDFSGSAIWAIGPNDDKFLLDLDLKKRTIQEQYDALFTMVNKWSRGGRVIEVGVEIDGQQQTNIFALKQMMMSKNFWFRFARQKGAPATQEGIRSRHVAGGKLERFKYIMPNFELNRMWFAEELKDTPDMKEMLEELRYVNHTSIGCLSGNTLIKTDIGNKKIINITEDDRVYTHNGHTSAVLRPKDARITGIAETYTLTTEGGSVNLTDTHKVLTLRGYVKVKDLIATDLIVKDTLCKLVNTDLDGQKSLAGINSQLPLLKVKENGYIATFMNKKQERYLKVWKSTIRIVTRIITKYVTLKYYQQQCIKHNMYLMTNTGTTESKKKEPKNNKKNFAGWLSWLKKVNISERKNKYETVDESANTAESPSILNRLTKMGQSIARQVADKKQEVYEKIVNIKSFLWLNVLSVVNSSSRKAQIINAVQISVTKNTGMSTQDQKLSFDNVKSAEMISKHGETVKNVIAQLNVVEINQPLNSFAEPVEVRLQQTLQELSTAQIVANSLLIKSVRKNKLEVVYDIETEINHNYTLSFGGVLHNSKHDDGIDLISQLGLISYLIPSNEVILSENEIVDHNNVYWDGIPGDDEEPERNSVIF